MNHPKEYQGKEVVILGLARNGVAAAKLFNEIGAIVTVNDRKPRECCPEADELENLGISVICGGHPQHLIHSGISLVVKNPGIPYFLELIQKATQLGIEIVTEVEVAYHICQAPIIGITGSNGKTTTTTWIGKMLEEEGLSPIVAGNIGRPLIDAVLESTYANRMVVELSSFQLKGTKQFHPQVACLLNIYETHMDYHGTMEDYISSKAKLFVNQTEEDIAVVNFDDEFCCKLLEGVKARLLPFSSKRILPMGVFVRPTFADESSVDRFIVYRDENDLEHVILPIKELGVPGMFNVENAMAATATAIASGVKLESITSVLRKVRGVEHRLEFVATINDISFYNDSKASNPVSTLKAIEAFNHPIVLIAGGQERKTEMNVLLPCIKQKVKAVVTLGETREKIINVAEQAGVTLLKSIDTHKNAAETLEDAVKAAYAFAQSGDVVLLSPACASWDMFSSFEERGRIFKESVHKIGSNLFEV